MQNQNRTFGLIGFPLGHSYSRGHFTAKFEREGLRFCSYQNFEIPSISLIREIITDTPDLIGLNVTIPYKQAIMPYLDEIDPVALTIGAVNTIRISRSGSRYSLKGYNTDAIGFTRSMTRWPLNNSIKALVFGTGGSSLAVKYALTAMNIGFTGVSRKSSELSIPYESVTPKIARDHLLWINCTPAGMYPDISAKLPLPYECLTPGHLLYDLIYNPETTLFLNEGIKAGSSVMNGSRMLYEQAEASWEIWTGPLS